MKNNLKILEETFNIVYKYTKKDLVGTQLAALLAVLNNEGINMIELADYLDSPQGSLSRNIKKLSKFKNSKGEMDGFNLIELRQDYENRRTYALYLSEKGRKLRADLNKKLKEINLI